MDARGLDTPPARATVSANKTGRWPHWRQPSLKEEKSKAQRAPNHAAGARHRVCQTKQQGATVKCRQQKKHGRRSAPVESLGRLWRRCRRSMCGGPHTQPAAVLPGEPPYQCQSAAGRCRSASQTRGRCPRPPVKTKQEVASGYESSGAARVHTVGAQLLDAA